MELVRPMITDTQRLDLPLSSGQDLHSRRFINHPFIAGFSQSINSVIRIATDAISLMKAGISVPAENLKQSLGLGGLLKAPEQLIDNARNNVSRKTSTSNIVQQASELGRNSSRGQQPAPQRNQTEDDIKQQLSNRNAGQAVNDQQRTESARSSSISQSTHQRPNNAPRISDPSNMGLKISHSRLEGTDLAIDAALIASGLGGLLVMEHAVDMALHTRLKKERVTSSNQSAHQTRSLSAVDFGPLKQAQFSGSSNKKETAAGNHSNKHPWEKGEQQTLNKVRR
jgi:hypothetical protein